MSTLFVLLSVQFSSAVALENSWIEKASMPTARAFLGVASVDGKIYAIGGDNGTAMGNLGNPFWHSHDIVNVCEEYDPASDTWVRRNSMPTARAGLAVAVFQGEIYCIGGRTQDSYSTGVNEVYNPATDSWTTKTPMLVANTRLVANVVNGKIYVLPIFSTSDFEVYDPQTDSWSSKTPPPTEVTGFGSAVIGEKIYFEGAQPRNETFAGQLGAIQIYDTSTNNWTVSSKHSTQYDLYGSGGKTTGELAPLGIYFFMGNITNAYDIRSDTWLIGAPMPNANYYSWVTDSSVPTLRYCAATVALNDTFYVIGGRAGIWGYFVDMKADNSNAQYFPIGYGAVQPNITVVSPANQKYNTSSVPLTFMVDKPVSSMQYSLDGHENVTIDGNLTLTGLPNGAHNITVYAKYTMGSFGASETIQFSVYSLEMSLIVPVAGIGLASAVAIGVGLTYYLKKRGQ